MFLKVADRIEINLEFAYGFMIFTLGHFRTYVFFFHAWIYIWLSIIDTKQARFAIQWTENFHILKKMNFWRQKQQFDKIWSLFMQQK